MRLFVAIDIPEALRERLDALRAELLPITSLRLVDPEDVHLTLKFLGEVAEEKLPKVVAALDGIDCSPVKLETTRIGTFPSVLWLGIRLQKRLAQLQQDVQRAVRPFTTHDPRPYKPHLTLARIGRLEARERWRLERLRKRPVRERWTASGFTLYRSALTPSGPLYTVVERFPLQKKESGLTGESAESAVSR